MFMPKSMAIAMVYVADRAVKFVPIEANKPKITLSASRKLTEGDVRIVTMRRQFGSHTAKANTDIAMINASAIYFGLEKTFCMTCNFILSTVH